FAEKGYHGAGLKEILARAATPKGSFYNFFSSKEDFAVQVAVRHGLAIADAFERHFAESDAPPLEILRSAHQAMLAQYEASQCARTCITARLALEAGGDGDGGLQAPLQRLAASWLSRLTGLIASAQAEGDARDDIPAADLAALFWQAWEGALIHMKLTGDSRPGRRSLELLIDTVLAAPDAKRAAKKTTAPAP
ncbi:MAG: TetR family transcriptional regulator C-terminal domain-containing protein, partial [Myxococcota bacterium]